MKNGKVEERDCCPDRFSASIDRQWVGKTDKLWPWWMGGGGDMGRIGLGGCWMDGGWWMGVGEICGELEGEEKHSSLDLVSSGSLCKHPVEDGLQEIIIIVTFFPIQIL